MFGLTIGASTTVLLTVYLGLFSETWGEFLTHEVSCGFEFYEDTFEDGGGHTLFGFTVGEGVYFLGLYFTDCWAMASQAIFAALGFTILGDSISFPFELLLLLLLVVGGDTTGFGWTGWGWEKVLGTSTGFDGADVIGVFFDSPSNWAILSLILITSQCQKMI